MPSTNHSTAAPSSLEFITISDPDDAKAAAVRTRVRKHVMKDIGKSRRRPKKNAIVELVIDPQCQLGSRKIDPFVRFPIEMGPEEQFLISNIFRDIDSTQRAMRFKWFSVSLMDKAAFYIVLANSAAHLDRERGLELSRKSVGADKYHFLALQSINKRLAGPASDISEGLIGAVAGFLVHNEVVSNFEDWQVHINGIQKLLAIRGGIEAISVPELRGTVSWCELRGAFVQDIPPRFPLPHSLASRYTTNGQKCNQSAQSSQLLEIWKTSIPQPTTWLNIYYDLFHFSVLTHLESTSTKGRSWIDSVNGGGWPNPQIHRLLSWRSIRNVATQNSVVDIKQEFLRLTALLYLGIIWAKFGVLPLGTKIFSEKLYKLHLHNNRISWGKMWPFEAWGLLVGAVGSVGEKRHYFFEELWALAIREGFSIDDVLRKAKEVCWIEDAFSQVDIYREMTAGVRVVMVEDEEV